MSKDINDLIKPVKRNGEFVNHKVTDHSLEVLSLCSSTFIEKHKIFVKGEYYDRDNSRGALLVFFDLETCKVIGL